MGSTSVRFSLTGDIAGQKQVQELKYYGSLLTPEQRYRRLGGNVTKIAGWFFLAYGAGTLIAVIQSCLPGAKPTPVGKKLLGLVLSLVTLGSGFWFIYLSVPQPPFGF
jgi:hypothetical protein